MYKITVNDNLNFEINPENSNWDLIEVESGRFNIIHNYISYDVVVLNADFENKSFSVRVNNAVYNLQAKDRFDLLAEKLGFTAKNSQKSNAIKAPMPGMVISIMVKEGQSVLKGESVLILEAMKMENVIKAAGDGMVKSVKIKQGMAVEKNQILIEFA
jgi:biotin carboxyl carrier protein